MAEMPEHEELSPGGGGGSNMSKQVHMAVPKTLLKAQDHLHRGRSSDPCFQCTFAGTYLVEETKAEVVDGLSLPLWQGRIERDRVGLEHTQRKGHDHSIRTEDVRAPCLAGPSIHLHA